MAGSNADFVISEKEEGQPEQVLRVSYKGTEPRAVILQNSHFVDAKVEIFAKYGSQQWKRIAEYPIERKLIER